MTNVELLYTYRVGTEYTNLSPMEYRSGIAKKIVSLSNQGHELQDIIAEHKVAGQWVHDQEAYTLAEKYAAKSPGTKANKVEKEITVKSSLSALAKAVRLAISTDMVSDDHIEAVRTAYAHFDILVSSAETKERNAVLSEMEIEVDESGVEKEYV
jgi:hypothetical protein